MLLPYTYPCFLLVSLLLTTADGQGEAPHQARPPVDKVYARASQMPTLVGGGDFVPVLEATVQKRLVLPEGISLTPSSLVIVKFIVGKTGHLEQVAMVNGVSPAVDARLLAGLRSVPALVPGREAGRPVRVAYANVSLRLVGSKTPAAALPPPPEPPFDPVAYTRDQRLTAHTRAEGVAQRWAGESATAFVQRVLPALYQKPRDLVTYAWRPTPFGPQLFLSQKGQKGTPNEYGSDVVVLDPFQADMYAVQTLTVPSMGDHTYLQALFFADVDQDGQKELLALSECSLREDFVHQAQRLTGRAPHYQTQIFQCVGLSPTGRPRYEEDLTPRPELDELATADEVRQALRSRRRAPAPR